MGASSDEFILRPSWRKVKLVDRLARWDLWLLKAFESRKILWSRFPFTLEPADAPDRGERSDAVL